MKDMPKKKKTEETWENRELGASEKFVRKVSAKKAKAIDDDLELQIISIRLQKKLIDDLKSLANDDGLGYQPYIRRLLTQHAREELKRRKKVS